MNTTNQPKTPTEIIARLSFKYEAYRRLERLEDELCKVSCDLVRMVHPLVIDAGNTYTDAEEDAGRQLDAFCLHHRHGRSLSDIDVMLTQIWVKNMAEESNYENKKTVEPEATTPKEDIPNKYTGEAEAHSVAVVTNVQSSDDASTEEPTAEVEDKINHPKHYGAIGGVECIDIKRHLPSSLGDALKYLWRRGKKAGSPATEDLKKARWYLKDWWGNRPTDIKIHNGEHICALATTALDEAQDSVLKHMLKYIMYLSSSDVYTRRATASSQYAILVTIIAKKLGDE
ncbi:MAG: DUF3310 domain-containing protein [Alistipes sp.]